MKKKRHEMILKLIKENEVATQDELLSMLISNGFSVTQATVSRDIRQLKLTKTSGPSGRSHYIVQKETQQELGGKYIQVLKNGFSGMDTAQNLLIIHTVSGMAMAVAAALDELKIQGIIGCIAGDNTIMCATKSSEIAQQVMAQIDKMLNGR